MESVWHKFPFFGPLSHLHLHTCIQYHTSISIYGLNTTYISIYGLNTTASFTYMDFVWAVICRWILYDIISFLINHILLLSLTVNLSCFPGSTNVSVIGTPNGRDDLQFSRHTFILQWLRSKCSSVFIFLSYFLLNSVIYASGIHPYFKRNLEFRILYTCNGNIQYKPVCGVKVVVVWISFWLVEKFASTWWNSRRNQLTFCDRK